jgi:hypothetical protein
LESACRKLRKHEEISQDNLIWIRHLSSDQWRRYNFDSDDGSVKYRKETLVAKIRSVGTFHGKIYGRVRKFPLLGVERRYWTMLRVDAKL